MKELVYTYQKMILTLLVIIFGISCPISAGAETCTFGQASLHASVQFMRFTQTPKNCKQAKKETKRITFNVSGDEAVSIYSTELHSGDDKESERAFTIYNALSYGLRPGDSIYSDITFLPSEFRSYSSTLIVTFGYANESLGPYRECLVRTFGAEVLRKKKMLEEFKQKGVDLSAPKKQEETIRLEHAQLRERLDPEKTKAETKAAKLRIEKERTLKELREGMYCSKCGHSKTQIESNGRETFEEHVKRVEGRIEPASAEQIENARKDYDSKIEWADGEVVRLTKQIDDANKKRVKDLLALETLKRQLIEAFNASVTRLEGYVSEARKRSEDAMKAWEKKRLARESLNISIEGECREK